MQGDDTPVIQMVLACDTERTRLLQEEASIIAKLNKPPSNGPPGKAAASAAADAAAADGAAAINGAPGAAAPESAGSRLAGVTSTSTGSGMGGAAGGAGPAGDAVVGNGGAAAAAVAAALTPAEEAALSSRLLAVYKRLEEIDAYGAEARAATILAGLSFDADMMRRATRTFSGGWRMRVALARCAEQTETSTS